MASNKVEGLLTVVYLGIGACIMNFSCTTLYDIEPEACN